MKTFEHDCDYYRDPIARYRIITTGHTGELTDEEKERGHDVIVYKCGMCGETWEVPPE